MRKLILPNIYVATGGALFIVLFTLIVFLSWSGEIDTIELRSDGFYPSNITIKVGDTVRFVTENNEPFWPASNVHPEHTAYPDFDPKQPIAPEDSWSFTFTESGKYRFHDHINPQFKGVIYVKDKNESIIKVDCSTEKTTQCWEELMLQTLESEGVGAAFDTLANLSETEPTFTTDCHGYAHLIGEKSYSLYLADKNFDVPASASLCGYGFYHSFMEALLQTTGNVQEARDFCTNAGKDLGERGYAAQQACYHGTGHGAVDGSDPTAWGDVESIMAPGFKLCDLLVETDLQAYLCATGVFNATEVLSRDKKYGIENLREDPFELCNTQPIERREACYSNMIPILLQKFSNDLDLIFSYVNENMIDGTVPAIDEHDINGLVTLGIAFEFIREYGTDDDYMQRAVALCRRQPEEDRLPCIEGISGGHLKYGPPNNEYIKNMEFCSLDILREDERDACYGYVLPRLVGDYGLNKARTICDMVPVQYKNKYCSYY